MHLFSTSRKLRIEEGVTKKTMYRNGIKKEHLTEITKNKEAMIFLNLYINEIEKIVEEIKNM